MQVIMNHTGDAVQNAQLLADFVKQKFPDAVVDGLSFRGNFYDRNGRPLSKDETYIFSDGKFRTLDKYLGTIAQKSIWEQLREYTSGYGSRLVEAEANYEKCQKKLATAQAKLWRTIPEREADVDKAKRQMDYIKSTESFCGAVLEPVSYFTLKLNCGRSYYRLYGACIVRACGKLFAVYGNGVTKDIYIRNADMDWKPDYKSETDSDYVYLTDFQV